MDWLIIVIVVAGPLLVFGALIWSASLRGPAAPPSPRKDSGEVPAVIPGEYSYEQRMEDERRASNPENRPPDVPGG
jgi:hypothetical protein